MLRPLVLCGSTLLLATAVVAADAPPRIQTWIEETRATNTARAALSAEQVAWQAERERLGAIVAALGAERERLGREADEAQRTVKASRDELTALGTGSDLDAVRGQLTTSAGELRERLAAIARTVPPGAVTVPTATGDNAFDDAARALEASERAAATLGVEVVPGDLAGKQVAVKLLRVAGACAWWVALDGRAAGTVAISDGRVRLEPAGDEPTRVAITRVLAMVEGREPVELVHLPFQPITTAGAKP